MGIIFPVPLSDLQEKERQTYRLDTLRHGVEGILYTLTDTVLLLIAIQFFHVSDFMKGLIPAAKFAGFFVAIFVSSSLLGKSQRITIPAALLTAASAVFLALAGIVPTGELFVIFVSLHLMLFYSRMPIFTALYAENYHDSRRGALYSTGLLLSILTGLVSSWIFGQLLDYRIELYRVIVIISSALLLGTLVLTIRIPSDAVGTSAKGDVLSHLALLLKNPLFGIVELSWFLVGFGNLWAHPLRIVYLAEEGRGLALSPFLVLIILGIVPNIVRIGFNRLWAKLFDKINVIIMRILINIFFAAGILLFFETENLFLISVASILFSVALAGSPIIWNLWVTKIAPPGQSQHYMGVHTFLAGVRGIVAPFAGFYMLQHISMRSIGRISTTLIFLSIVILIPVIKKWDKKK